MVDLNPLKWFAKEPLAEIISQEPTIDYVNLGIDTTPANDIPKIDYEMLGGIQGAARYSYHDGEKFTGGYGFTELLRTDYWTLRARSAELFEKNLYARGLIRRLVTNEINTGLCPEASPDEKLIGVPEDSLHDWTETAETRFDIWARNENLCDWKHGKNFAALQREIRREALVCGDILVVLRINQRTKLPMIQLISGEKVQSPLVSERELPEGHELRHGVEFDRNERVVAHWVRQKDLSFKRLPAYGSRTGRRMSWLVYGTDKRMDDVRGQPLLSLVLQSLKEIDRYRDSVQRKAVINSILAMFVEKSEDKIGSLPLTGSAVRHNQVKEEPTEQGSRSFNIESQVPGVVIQELQHGEKPVAMNSNGTDTSFGVFEEAIVQAVAWANEIPPELLRLAFSNNYSASQAAINEFKIYLNRIWAEFGAEVCRPIYIEWLISETLTGKIQAPGMLDAWRDPTQYDTFGAWVIADWYGSIKPSTDMLKQAKGSELLVKNGWSTNAREARVTTGTKFSRNVARLARENALLAQAMQPLAEFKQKYSVDMDAIQTEGAAQATATHTPLDITAQMAELSQQMNDYFSEATQ